MLLSAPMLPAGAEDDEESEIEINEAPPEPEEKEKVPLHERINSAIERGVVWLKKAQKSDGSWGPVVGNKEYGVSEAGPDRDSHVTGPTSFALFTLVSTVFSIDWTNSLTDNRELIVFLLIPLYAVIINSHRRLKITLATMLASAVISALVGLFNAVTRGISLDHRLTGFTSHWMTYAGLLMCTFIYFFVFVLESGCSFT